LILDYQANSLTTVEEIQSGCWRIISSVNDDLFGAELLLEVWAPALDIRVARLDIKRDDLGQNLPFVEQTEKLVGVRVGPGMTKIVRSLIGGEGGSNRISELVLESMEMLINAITVPELRKANQAGGKTFRASSDGPKIFLNDRVIGAEAAMVMAENPRLKDSCVAFRDE
jgi:hypothetical protein